MGVIHRQEGKLEQERNIELELVSSESLLRMEFYGWCQRAVGGIGTYYSGGVG